MNTHQQALARLKETAEDEPWGEPYEVMVEQLVANGFKIGPKVTGTMDTYKLLRFAGEGALKKAMRAAKWKPTPDEDTDFPDVNMGNGPEYYIVPPTFGKSGEYNGIVLSPHSKTIYVGPM